MIGDGAMTAGIAFEAMMHAGHLGNDLNIILMTMTCQYQKMSKAFLTI